MIISGTSTFFFFKQKTAYEMRISDWSSDVCSSDRYKAADLTDIGSLVPNVIVSDYKINGGGSLSIRGISSPATQIGFEQPVRSEERRVGKECVSPCRSRW